MKGSQPSNSLNCTANIGEVMTKREARDERAGRRGESGDQRVASRERPGSGETRESRDEAVRKSVESRESRQSGVEAAGSRGSPESRQLGVEAAGSRGSWESRQSRQSSDEVAVENRGS
jgi:hypothetical protein